MAAGPWSDRPYLSGSPVRTGSLGFRGRPRNRVGDPNRPPPARWGSLNQKSSRMKNGPINVTHSLPQPSVRPRLDFRLVIGSEKLAQTRRSSKAPPSGLFPMSPRLASDAPRAVQQGMMPVQTAPEAETN